MPRRLVHALLGVILSCGCGGLNVSPAAPSTTSQSIKSGHPTLLTLHGQLADGGSFSGYIVYGSRDIEGRVQTGRYQAAYWYVMVKGGAATRDSHFTYVNSGRALVETYTTPSRAIGLTFLWPDHDPELQWFTPHFRAVDAYDPDVPPAVSDFGDLLPGSLEEGISIYRDGQGGSTFITSVTFEPSMAVSPER